VRSLSENVKQVFWRSLRSLVSSLETGNSFFGGLGQGLKSGPHVCSAGVLLLEPLDQPRNWEFLAHI
jgi:hypothetical protein